MYTTKRMSNQLHATDLFLSFKYSVRNVPSRSERGLFMFSLFHPIPNQKNPAHILAHYFSTIPFNIILPSTLQTSKYSHRGSQTKILYTFLTSSVMCSIPCLFQAQSIDLQGLKTVKRIKVKVFCDMTVRTVMEDIDVSNVSAA